MTFADSAPLDVLVIGGTGTISASTVRLAVEAGMRLVVLNRGRNGLQRELPAGVTELTADVGDSAAVGEALGDRRFDAVLNFLSYDVRDATRMVELFRDRIGQYVHISTASLYGKPVLQSPITESTQRHNRFVQYSRDKLAIEELLLRRYADDGFPVTIVRPSHTYDDHAPPLPGGWTVVDRLARGAEIPVHGDGTSLWTVTHADDFAGGLVGLIGNPRAIGETFHITGDDVYTWDQIYSIFAAALGVEARLVHIPSEFFVLAAPDWDWSELLVGDLSHSALFDNVKIRRHVPSFRPTRTLHRAARRMVAWRAEHLDLTAPDVSTDGVLDRLVAGYHASRDIFLRLASESA
jgi:nucleoside-diphosphate-sugar epimerase